MLIERSQAGDMQAFNALVRKYEDRAYKYAFRLVRSQDEASDIVADAFVRVHAALHNFRGQSAFGTWLYRIVTNCFLDARKRERRHQHQSLDISNPGGEGELERQIEDTAEGPAEIAVKSAREEAVQSALGEMPEFQRAMLVMYHVEGLSYEEIAEALDLPLGTVKSRLNRARVALRDQLSGHLELFQE